MSTETLHMGLDIGSTTAKLVILNRNKDLLYCRYRRHLSHIRQSTLNLFKEADRLYPGRNFYVQITGSAGISLAKNLDIPFAQEVIAASGAVKRLIPTTDVAIELGGEDAKITYFRGGIDQRMNGTCAGGTGAFIDQMAVLLETDAQGLNKLAESASTIYPIASRCGVFAKTDLQPLINEGADKRDIAVSILQAVVNQTISGLAQGKPIRGKVAFLGGPLHFLPQLRDRFIKTLKLTEEDYIIPENGHYFVAMGAALTAPESSVTALSMVMDKLDRLAKPLTIEKNRLPPLFAGKAELEEFRQRHRVARVVRREPSALSGPCFLGLDSGSTTTKAALIDADGALLCSFYENNAGSPLSTAVRMLKKLYSQLPGGTRIARTTVTGYGEKLLQAALKADIGEIETVAHYKAANFFLPGVDFILDIGGQDMKCLRVVNGVIDEILLNEACSSGCGSFLETFAVSLDLSVEDFSAAALGASAPVDLGSRCTVFMNSRVKQAQNEGCSVGDISAGLSYSVIKNALTKVIKLKKPGDLGRKIILQGGTFYNEAVLRAFELVSGREAVRPDICGLMGAFGAALIARERHDGVSKSSLLRPQELKSFSVETNISRCGLCANNCLITWNRFPGGRIFTTGNRCERGAGMEKAAKTHLPDLYTWKYRRLFSYTPLDRDQSIATVGIPRGLNIYENYPFWFTFLTALGYRVILSRKSDKSLFESGVETIPAESVCYPAKLMHGHVEDLIRKKVDIIFYPSVPYEKKEFAEASNHFNCPIVAAYAEVIRTNMDGLNGEGPEFLAPFLSLGNHRKLVNRLHQVFRDKGFSRGEVKNALNLAWKEWERVRQDIRAEGKKALRTIRQQGLKGIVLSGRPYHIDPEINHGIPGMITRMGMAVLSEDAVAHCARKILPLRVFDQWVYHSRLYAAAHFVSSQEDLELVQLNSFGCGIDAVTTDQVHEILHPGGKTYTLLKIDEGSQLGAARIRLRSLKAAMDERSRDRQKRGTEKAAEKRPVFTKKMKKSYTILAPQMSPIHFQFIEQAFRNSGFNIVVLPKADEGSVNTGLRYVNNDACYPTIITIGQVMEALESGEYDRNRISVLMTQTGGGCRATNYIAFLKKALADAGMKQVPVISLNALGMEKNPGFNLSLKLIHRSLMAVIYGDLLMRVLLRTRPYEEISGSAEELYYLWVRRCTDSLGRADMGVFNRDLKEIVRDFDQLKLTNQRKPRVGLVGEILVKYHPFANNQIIGMIEQEGCEAVVPDLLDFFLYSAFNAEFRYSFLGGSRGKRTVSRLIIRFIESYRKKMRIYLKNSDRFNTPVRIEELAKKTEPVVSLGTQMGEGWFLTGEMIELIESGTDNIVCMQPFACLPNQITGKGMIKALKERYPQANIAAIDYDPGASELNQQNRIKLLLAVAFRKIEKGGDVAAEAMLPQLN